MLLLLVTSLEIVRERSVSRFGYKCPKIETCLKDGVLGYGLKDVVYWLLWNISSVLCLSLLLDVVL